MQPNTQQPTGEQQGFYRPTQPSPYQGQDFSADEQLVAAPVDPNASVSWEASEYIHHSKGAQWAIIFGAIVVAGLALTIWLQAWTMVGLVVAMAVAFGVFAFRPPKVKHYTLTHDGLTIDNKTYALSDFRSFGVLSEDAFFSIMLIPIKRFMPAISMYFAQEDGEQIVDILGSHLPLEDLHLDPIDAIMRRLHF
ncbi:MAG TPA: hypothetical protein VLG40_04960 [Candidatus Saccharimonas sp.]|nr:hypothetical protein [Candidatus Saccharimonas sp.]